MMYKKLLINLMITRTLCFDYKYPILDDKHKYMQRYINNPKTSIIINYGPAGTGKTLVATQEAIRLLKENKQYDKIVLTRPLKTVDNENIGFLPGDINKKILPWVIPILDYFKAYYTLEEINKLKNLNKLEIVPLGFMRGRTFSNAIIIADEMQNSNSLQMKMLLTRIGLNSKIIILGDTEQGDLNDKSNGLIDLINTLDNYYLDKKHELYSNGFAVVKYTNENIKRHEIIEKIINIYKN